MAHGSMAGIFAFVLLGVFAAGCLLLTVMGAGVYRGTAAAGREHNADRILYAYIRSMVRSADGFAEISKEESEGVETLALREIYDGEAYVTRLYCSGGKLREWFSAQTHEFRPEDGEPICDALSMSLDMTPGLITAVIQAREGEAPVRVQVRHFCM